MSRSLAGRLLWWTLPAPVTVLVLALLLPRWVERWAVALICLTAGVLLLALLIRRALRPVHALFRALAGSVNTYRDGEYNFGIRWPGGADELAALVDTHAQLGEVLREQRHALVQRELLLDTMVQNTPVAMLLTTGGGVGQRVVFSNIAARKLLHRGWKLEGRLLAELLAETPPQFCEAFGRGGDGLFSVPDGTEGEEQVYYLARRVFQLNGRRHELVLLRRLTSELRREEMRAWKKVIRVISHELNNSLAPVASLARSGAEMLRRGRTERLHEVFATIEERVGHLEAFLGSYARFAKLPQPRLEIVEWPRFLQRLRQQVDFQTELPDGAPSSRMDAAQVEQALLNLLRNAHESGSTPGEVRLRLTRLPAALRIEVLDRGQGMSDAVLQNALVPFYSTKRQGTGLGLALVREIAEAHGGHVSLHNRPDGGLCVALQLPDQMEG